MSSGSSRFIRALTGARWGAPLGPLGFVWFIHARPGGRLVHLSSLGSLRRALRVVVFVRARPVVGGFIRVLWVSSGAPWETSCSFGFVRFIRARSGGRWVHFGAPLVSSGS